MTVTQAPGADNINLENVTVQWVGPSGSYKIISGAAAGGVDPFFSTSAFKDDDGSAPVVNDPDDRLVMEFHPGKHFGEKLDSGATVRLKISTQSGGAVTTTLLVPESLAGKQAVVL